MLLIPYRWFLMASFLGSLWFAGLALAIGFVGGWYLCAKRGGKV